MKRFSFVLVILAALAVATFLVQQRGVLMAQEQKAPAQGVVEEEVPKKKLNEEIPPTPEDLKKINDEKAKKILEERRKNLPPIKMIYVEGGCYKMGDFTGKGDDDERPAHKVCVSDFYIGETEVTNGLWEAVMGFPFKPNLDPKMPLTDITWAWANRFIDNLNKLTDGFYRLPTEAEWEYAARDRGKDMKWAGTNNEDDLVDYGWFLYNSDGKPHYGRLKRPNALGIYDMSGNVWEWVEDNFDFDYYKNSPVQDPYGPDFSLWRTIRGGSYVEEPNKLRTTYRNAMEENLAAPNIGFRLAE